MTENGTQTWPVVRLNGTELQARSETHYLKLLALQRFLAALLNSPVREHVAKVVLFGSVAWGDPQPDSDVDVLVIGLQDLKELGTQCADLAYKAMLETGEFLQPIVYSLSRWQIPDSDFVTEVMRSGKGVYEMAPETLQHRTAQNLYFLAGEHLRVAEKLLADGEWRVTVDIAYNAAELCAKAFLVGKLERMPTQHGSVVQKFSQLYILQEQRFSHSLGRRLNTALRCRHDARYVYEATITEEMARETVSLAREMHEYLRQYLIEETDDDEQENNP